jgi:hypothetical protein
MVDSTRRIVGLNVGLTGIDQWRARDEQHLPPGGRTRPAFFPEVRPLDAILRRETLDERLAGDVVPDELSSELLLPAVLGEVRKSLKSRLEAAGRRASGRARDHIMAGAALLETEVALDEEIREALAALLRG